MRGTGYRQLCLLMVAATVALGTGADQVTAAQSDQEALLGRLRVLMEGSGATRLALPMPGSRSVVVVADISSPTFFFLERGSIRGSAIDVFYSAYDAGDDAAAFLAFRASALPTVRVTDYGWNGLGVPLVTDAGTEVGDVLYRSVEGLFGRAPAILDDDISRYVESIQALIAVLEQR